MKKQIKKKKQTAKVPAKKKHSGRAFDISQRKTRVIYDKVEDLEDDVDVIFLFHKLRAGFPRQFNAVASTRIPRRRDVNKGAKK